MLCLFTSFSISQSSVIILLVIVDQDINERRSIAEAVRTESAFFQRHPAYRVLAHRLGTGYLARLLNQVLMNHIKDCLPDIKNRIAAQVMEIEHELASFGDPLQSSETSQVRISCMRCCSIMLKLIGQCVI